MKTSIVVAVLSIVCGTLAAAEPRPKQEPARQPVAAPLADEPPASRGDLAAAIDRGLGFLAKDALAWKAKHNCVSCHHAALIVWSMREARQRGYSVDQPVLAELTTWVAKSGDGRTSLPRPTGIPKALNVKPVWFALALGADPKPDAESQEGLKRLLKTVKDDQTESGSWAAWPETRPPIFGPSDESMTALATLALLPAADADDAAKQARDKAIAWLTARKTDGDAQSIAMRLILWSRLARPATEREALVQQVKDRQNADGGWSQAKDMASDAWATGQALYALAQAGLKPEEPAIARGQAFLLKSQRADGSWPMTSRPTKPSSKGAESLMPITGAGSAWGVLGLVRSSRTREK